MAKKSAAQQLAKKNSKAQLILFAVVAAVMMLAASLLGEFRLTSWRIFIVPSSRKEFDIGLRAFQGDEPKGRQQIEKAIDEAQKSNPPTGDTVARRA